MKHFAESYGSKPTTDGYQEAAEIRDAMKAHDSARGSSKGQGQLGQGKESGK